MTETLTGDIPTEEEMDYSWYPDIKDFDFIYLSSRIPCIISYSLTFFLGILGNSLVIWITGFKLRSVSAVWFLNLAITDLICNIALLPRIIQRMISEFWLDSYNFCEYTTSFIFFNMLASVYFLTIISIDRCVSVICPIWSKIHRTPRLAKIISGITWTMCLIIFVPYVIFFHFEFGVSDCNNKLLSHLMYYYIIFTQMLPVPKLVLIFVVPFLIISICSGLVVFKLKSLNRPLGSEKPFRVITAVVLCFFICWCPYSIWPLIPVGKTYWKTDFIIYEICICLAYFNSCLNPILYVAFSRDFKAQFTLRSLPARLKTVLNDQNETSGDKPMYNPTDLLNTSSI